MIFFDLTDGRYQVEYENVKKQEGRKRPPNYKPSSSIKISIKSVSQSIS